MMYFISRFYKLDVYHPNKDKNLKIIEDFPRNNNRGSIFILETRNNTWKADTISYCQMLASVCWPLLTCRAMQRLIRKSQLPNFTMGFLN